MEKLLFEFIQVFIGNRRLLSVSISDTDWLRLFDFCKRQALLGVGFYAVERLHQQGIECPVSLKMKWMALALQIEKQNRKLNRQCKELTERLEYDGLYCCILKGQGNLLNYPEDLKLRRNPGDIDIWCATPAKGLSIVVQTGKSRMGNVTYHGRKAVMEYVLTQHRLVGNEKAVIRYHHIDAPDIDGIPIEVHFRVGYINSPLRNRKMQRWFNGQAAVCMKNKTHLGFSVPTPSVNVVYQMTHLFTHYFDDGLGLRQLMDYYFVLKVWHNDIMECQDLQLQGMRLESLGVPVMSKDEVMRVLTSLGMGKFAAAVMWVLHEVFAMPTHYHICESNEKEGRKLLAEIMRGGNFGQYDERGNTMKNGGTIPHAIWKLKRIMRLTSSYPEEAFCEPFFRVWHLFWRIVHK